MTLAKLTWRRNGNEVVEEIVGLVPEGAPLYDVNDEEEVVEIDNTSNLLDKTDLVYFEDEKGIFSLRPEWIVSIEIIQEPNREENMGINERTTTQQETVMNTIKNVVTSTKNFVVNHKTGITIISTVIAMSVIQNRTLREHNRFLMEHDLYNEFYSVPE